MEKAGSRVSCCGVKGLGFAKAIMGGVLKNEFYVDRCRPRQLETVWSLRNVKPYYVTRTAFFLLWLACQRFFKNRCFGDRSFSFFN